MTGTGFGLGWNLFDKTNLRFDPGFLLTARPQGTQGGAGRLHRFADSLYAACDKKVDLRGV